MTREEKILVARNLKNNAVRMGNFEYALKFRNVEKAAIGRNAHPEVPYGKPYDLKITINPSGLLEGMKLMWTSQIFNPTPTKQ